MKYFFTFFMLACFHTYPLWGQSLDLVTIFEYPNFENTTDLKLLHNAIVKDGMVRLTDAYESQKGGLWYTKVPVDVYKGFSTEFRFRISNPGGYGEGADGIALIIHNSQQNIDEGDNGGGMGYDGIPQCIAVEFDTFDNDEFSNNHISIQTKGNAPNRSTMDASIAINRNIGVYLKDGQVHNVKITYVNKQLSVFLDNMQKAKLTATVDIPNTIQLDEGRAWIGLAAATGAGFERHDIMSWSLKTTDPQKKNIEVVSTPIKPEVIENRKVELTKIIEVNSPNITVRVWDNKEQDGDIISLNLNGGWVVENYTLHHKMKDFKVSLSENENYLVLHAINLGKIPPNTASMAILDGERQQTFVLSSTLNESQGISIVYKKK